MARDLRQVGYSKEDYPDKCYLYPTNYVNDNNEVDVNVQPICRFYKKDLVSFAWKKIQLGNGSFSNSNHFIGTIESMDHLEMARVGMYVKDQTGMLFVIDEPLISDDENKSKVVGRRPAIITTMTLRGVE